MRKPHIGIGKEALITVLQLPFFLVFFLEPGTEEVKKLLLLLLGCAVQVSLIMFVSMKHLSY